MSPGAGKYVTALPGPRGKWQISTDGGTQPVWTRDGRSLFFRADGKVMKVAIERPPSPEPVKHPPTVLFDDMYVRGHPALANYDVSIDGSRLLMIKGEHPERTSEIRVLQGWKSKVTSQLEQSRSR
jgi:hypothetical protein